ncbi:hypothetical protein NDA03_25875, partial [Trichocoleus sp. Lan]|uniref:hypothetical protein n=1 Tax=Trichocoleus sp. Lan TaxID=2933927 RepID=UPI00329996D4
NAAATDEPSDSYADQSVRPYVEMLSLNETVAYQRKRDGEIICAYLGTSTNQLAKQWVSTLELWGCSAEIRKPKRITGSKWEIKIKNADITRLTKLAESHPAFNSGVPAPKSESLELVQDIPETSSENSTKCDATTNPSASVELRFNDEVLIESDSVPGLRGKIGQVKTIGSNWIGVECEGRLHEFFATELTLISGVEPPQPKTVNAAFKAIASWSPYSSKRIG